MSDNKTFNQKTQLNTPDNNNIQEKAIEKNESQEPLYPQKEKDTSELDNLDSSKISKENLLGSPNPNNQTSEKIESSKKSSMSQKIEENQKLLNRKYLEDSLANRAFNATTKGATTYAAMEVGKTMIHASFSTIFNTCQVILSQNKKKALARALPGLALSLIPGVGIFAGIALSVGTSYLGGKVYDSVLSSRNVDVHHEIFLPNSLLSKIDDETNLLKVKLMQMGSPFYDCRSEIVDIILKAEEIIDKKIGTMFDELKLEVNDTIIINLTVDASAEKIIELVEKIQEWYNLLCLNLQEIELLISILLEEKSENLFKIQSDISKQYDALIVLLTSDLPVALKNGLDHMDETLKKVRA